MIYADFNGSSPLCSKVKEHLVDRIQEGPFANPNAIHCLGQTIYRAMEKCRNICSKTLGCKRENIIFNSGASEGISQVFHTILSEPESGRDTFIISDIEHSAVANAAEYYSNRGLNLLTLPVNSDGVVKLDILKNWILEYGDRLALISIMAANNETGIIQPIEDIVKMAGDFAIPVFSDTTQFIGKTSFNFDESKLDYAVLSGHKIGGLIGSGILLAKNPELIKPLIFGGGQERGYRGGTQNFIGNETLAVALTSFKDGKLAQMESLKSARESFEQKLKAEFPNLVIIGEKSPRLPGTSLISLPGVHGQAVQIELESHEIFVTTSSACSDNEPNTSRVLKAMNVSDDIGRGVIRISLCAHNAEENYKTVYEALVPIYKKLSQIKSF